MSDVRDEMARVVASTHFGLGPAGDMRVVDAIMERWDLTPKPVISDRDLGILVRQALQSAWYDDVAQLTSIGADVRAALVVAGLEIVKVSDAS